MKKLLLAIFPICLIGTLFTIDAMRTNYQIKIDSQKEEINSLESYVSKQKRTISNLKTIHNPTVKELQRLRSEVLKHINQKKNNKK